MFQVVDALHYRIIKMIFCSSVPLGGLEKISLALLAPELFILERSERVRKKVRTSVLVLLEGREASR